MRRCSREDDNLRCFNGPRGQLFERAALGALDEFIDRDAPCVHATAAHADVGLERRDGLQHAVQVVVAIGDGLPLLGARRGIAHEEDAHGLALALGDGAGEPKAVVAPFGAVRGVVENEKGVHEPYPAVGSGLQGTKGKGLSR